ncbi:hypothetical protein NE237_020516 [Protea cynaroides]|uniref:TF-B3 domain-containing protein n=1 Tax=Protea cynaroides TaxID=273540 RepID=A0A9Q0H641_9MAGN|nr:hypothetical protein NE237_020516 [Protea cynaroides]
MRGKEMGYKLECCTECTRKCFLIHGKRDPTPIATSFFKVLVDDRFSEVLFLPPKFARTLCSMLGQKSKLEDSNGQRWRVKLSTIDGSLAFRQGWDEFASDHSLKIGQLLVFTYIIGSHFVVQIYDENGCEKLNFSQNTKSGSGRKAKPKFSSDHLPSDCRNSIPKEAPPITIDSGSMKEQGSSSTVPSASKIGIIDSDVKDAKKTEMAAKNTSLCDISQERPKSPPTVDCAEVPYYIIDRDFITEQGETRTSLFDLSNFEMVREQSGADRMEKVSAVAGEKMSPHGNGNSERPQASVGEGTVDKDPAAVEGASGQASFNVSDLEITGMDWSAEDIDKVPPNIKKDSCHASLQPQIPSSGQPDEKVKWKPDTSNTIFGQNPLTVRRNFTDLGNKSAVKFKMEETPLVGSSGSIPQIMTKISGCFGAPVVSEAKKVCLTGEKYKIIKEEFEEKVNLRSKDEEKTYKSVKTEPMDSDDLPPPALINFCYSVTAHTQSWLELPTVSVLGKGKSKRERTIVLLRDPDMRKWAVLYHERPGFRVLTRGWKAFARANHIQPGDVYIFGVENQSESCSVSILLGTVDILQLMKSYIHKGTRKVEVFVVDFSLENVLLEEEEFQNPKLDGWMSRPWNKFGRYPTRVEGPQSFKILSSNLFAGLRMRPESCDADSQLYNSIYLFRLSPHNHIQGELTELAEKNERRECLEMRLRKTVELSNPEREDECGIFMEACTKMVLPNCGHSMTPCASATSMTGVANSLSFVEGEVKKGKDESASS